MQTIYPHLWFDKNVKEAVEFYVSTFPDSKITNISTITGTPSGDCDLVSFKLSGQPFLGIGAGPEFTFNPSISFMVNFDPSRDSQARQHLDSMWKALSSGGNVLMPLESYPFSEHYGWVQDKYGVSWQLILTNPSGDERPFIVPSLMYTGDASGKAEEATDFYMTVFDNSKRGITARYPTGMEPEKEGTVMFTDFQISDQWFAAMDGGHDHDFAFNEAISFIVPCDNQNEIDYFWEKLSAVPAAEQCGWLKDSFGVSWQIVPTIMDQIMTSSTPEQMERVTKAFLSMKKFDIAALEKANKE